jgi:hypothetical protein
MLKRIFEAKTCVKISACYYTDDNGMCDYEDRVKNISRHFSNKVSLLDKMDYTHSYYALN